jgi:hypothetical protein
MKEAQFLTAASEFIEWLSHKLDGASLKHCWLSRSIKTGIPKGDIWSCTSLYDAFDKYLWPAECPTTGASIFSFAETEACLHELRTQLLAAISAEEAGDCISLCRQVLRWGGVARNQYIARQLIGLGNDLPTYLKAIQGHFKRKDLDVIDIERRVHVAGRKLSIELDSGTTKIYSLISPEFIIYDSRVAAALGHLVLMWAAEIHDGNVDAVPACLRFANAGANNKYRNPQPTGSRSGFFPHLTNRDGSRISHNLRANWLIKKLALSAHSTRFEQLGTVSAKMRAIESALFMVGYSIA